MTTVVPQAKIHASKSTFEEKCARAKQSDCAHELAVLLGAISMEKGREDDKRVTFQSVLERKFDVGSVALQCLFHLGTLGSDAHRRGVETIIAKGYNSDTDHIYAGAINSMLKLSDLNAADLTIVALALHGSSRELRSSVLHTLRSLESTRLKELRTLNEQNVTACTPFARAFGKTLEDAQIEAEVIEAIAVPQLDGTSQSRRR
jgi:hypothetical protein